MERNVSNAKQAAETSTLKWPKSHFREWKEISFAESSGPPRNERKKAVDEKSQNEVEIKFTHQNIYGCRVECCQDGDDLTAPFTSCCNFFRIPFGEAKQWNHFLKNRRKKWHKGALARSALAQLHCNHCCISSNCRSGLFNYTFHVSPFLFSPLKVLSVPANTWTDVWSCCPGRSMHLTVTVCLPMSSIAISIKTKRNVRFAFLVLPFNSNYI